MPVGTLQGTLFAAGPDVGLRPLTEGVERIALRDGAWVDVRRSWVVGADTLLGRLVDGVCWHAGRRPMYGRMVDVPRLDRFFDGGEQLPHPVLAAAMRSLDRRYGGILGERFRTVGMCLYRGGDDSVAWHGDTVGRGATEDTVVAIVSLGATRPFRLRRRGGGPARRFDLSSGDLLVMGGSCQRTFEHQVPKTARPVGARVSVQFRPAGVR